MNTVKEKWLNKVNDKVINLQNNIWTFSDKLHHDIFSQEECFLTEQELKAKTVFISLTDDRYQRYQTFSEYINDKTEWPDDPEIQKLYSQGVISCMKWKDAPLMKTTTDLAILNMLIWELKPGCIVEIGSGNGSSAEYFSDITQVYKLNTKIVTFDINPVQKQYERVSYNYGDCNNIETFNCIEKFIDKDKPTLFVEDAHVNVSGTLKKLLTYAKPGDYFFVEDGALKQKELQEVMSSQGLYLDRYYLDFFGKNSSSSMNGIFKVTFDFMSQDDYS